MSTKQRLNILWNNADPVTSELMVVMYAVNSVGMGWWEAVTLIAGAAPWPWFWKILNSRD